ncbi:MAG TPA: ubiquinol-cytochrome C chaperone family protein [Sphingomicrobium sp.]|nr:ubiquinol-cytochrome C chaperone family protein [Sphingomicrobium sp.]
MRAWLTRLVSSPRTSSPLYERVVSEARLPHWYVEGQVPDTIDGRFAVLTTLLALVSVRLERGGESAQRAGIDLTEQFITDMDAEVRQLGIGDPTIGKQVGGMVGALGGRVGAWRGVLSGDEDWNAVTIRSLYRGRAPDQAALAHGAEGLRTFWDRLGPLGGAALIAGDIQ